MTQNYFVKSKYPRRDGDFYPTIDSRCVIALVESLPYIKDGLICDPCAPDGSGIIDSLLNMGVKAKGVGNAYSKKLPKGTRWVVSNPPYKLGVVDGIIKAQIDRIATGEIVGVFMLLRSTFDHAKKYKPLFRECEFYAGQIKLTFRPRWIEDSTGSPIHNYVWHAWTHGSQFKSDAWVKYW